ncbi:MAG: hypothetical protein RL571_1803 [Pseudomonadota bacterium]|jgi:hypothetical protein
MKAIFLAPRDNFTGNLLWNKDQFKNRLADVSGSLTALRKIGYYVSPFPEGDGVSFYIENKEIIKSNDEILNDFKSCFHWVNISKGESKNLNYELANLEPDRKINCIIIIPLDKIYIQETLELHPYTFFCRKEFDIEPDERLAEYENEYLQFESTLQYKDLLRLNKTLDHNNDVINQCLSLAEYAMDLVRYVHSSFLKKEYTPNPAGQMSDGFFEVKIIPKEHTHIKPIKLAGISRPISVSNNWLGPQVDHLDAYGIEYLASIYSGEIKNEMALSIKVALRLCRQSFYTLGSESQFLSLVFALDGLTKPKGNGWQQRTYIAALLCGGCPNEFEQVLLRYNELYEVRNKLVHKGLDFYQLTENPEQACDDMYKFIKDVIGLVSSIRFINANNMRAYAKKLLTTQDFKEKYTAVINSQPLPEGSSKHNMPSW